MKKILLFIVSAVLVLGLVLTGKVSVKATTENYIDTGITTDIPNSNNGSGCFIGFNEWLKTADDLYSFLELEFGQNCQNTDFIGRLGEQLIMAQNLGYIDADFKPCILYISSEDLLNKWLRDNLFIEYGATYKEGITGVSNGEYSPVGKEGFHALHQLLKLRGELQVYTLSPADIPGVFYKVNLDADSLTDTWYIFSEIKKPYVISNTWQYKSLEYDCPVEECSIIDLPDSVGKVNQISSNTYEYVYSSVYFDDEFGYYSLSQSDTKVMQLTKSQLPTFVFDTNGKLKDVYISKQDNLWTMPKVEDVKEKIDINYMIEEEFYYGVDIAGAVVNYNLICAYLVFHDTKGNYIPTDTIEEVELNFVMQEEPTFFTQIGHIFGYKYKTFQCRCLLKRGDVVDAPVFPEGPLISHTILYKDKNLTAIQKDDYNIFYNGKMYKYDYKLYLADEKKQVTNANNPFAFRTDYHPTQKIIEGHLIVSYQSVIYNLKNINDWINDKPIIDHNEDPTLLDKIIEFILMIWNSGLFGKILIILVGLLILFPIIYVGIKLLKLVIRFFSYIKNKKSTS